MSRPSIGLLHTAQVHVATFDALIDGRAVATHQVLPALLDRARTTGIDDALRADIRCALLRFDPAHPVVCTCSTIGAAAEEEGQAAGREVIRVDRPMAEAAVRTAAASPGRRIAVVAAVSSTVGPTTELLGSVAEAQGVDVDLCTVSCPDAWAHFEAGDTQRYVLEVARAARRAQALDPVDVVVLAQASMAPAVAHLADLGVPVLCSPGLAVETVLARLI